MRLWLPPSLANHKPRFPFNSAISISNCIIHDNGLGGIYMRGGDKRNLLPSGNLVFNCEFYRNSRANLKYTPSLSIYDVGAFHSQWDDSWWRQNLDSPDWQYKLKKLVDIEADVYQKKYPLLKDFFKNDRPRVNYITQNLYYRTSGALNGNYVYKWNNVLNPSQKVPPNKKNWTPQDVQKYFGDNGIVKSILSTPFYTSE